MPDYTVVKLQHFKSGLHLARGLTNAYDRTHDTLHSDKLKSAIFVSALQLFGKGEINESFFHAFTISSHTWRSIRRGARARSVLQQSLRIGLAVQISSGSKRSQQTVQPMLWT